jgi:hypothetical protein
VPAVGYLLQLTAWRRFFRVVDIGNENAVSAEIEGLLDSRTVVVSADADDGLGPAVGNGCQHGGKFFVVHRSVLGVDQQPVVAAVGQLLGNGGAVSVQEQAHLRRAFAQLFLEIGATEGGFGHRKIPPDESYLV